MPCYQLPNLPGGVTTTGRTSYRTEAECNQACKEGACCEGTTCTVKPQCQCQGAGQTFKGVGTVCTGVNCGCCGGGEVFGVGAVSVSVTRTLDVVANSSCSCVAFQNPPSVATRCVNQSSSFSQYGTLQSCQRTVQGTTDDYGTVQGTVGFLQSPCKVYCLLAWPLNPCGVLSQTYYAWDFVFGQTSYSATYYVFLFVDGQGGSISVSSLTSSVPATPTHSVSGRSYAYGGAMWSVTLGVSFA
jgi:hypothetical protein